MESGGDLLSRAVSSQVPSALRGLTAVFGMGTGGTLSSLPPEMVAIHFAHPDNCTSNDSSTLDLSLALSAQLISGSSRFRGFRRFFASRLLLSRFKLTFLRLLAVCFTSASRTLTTAHRMILLPRFDLFPCSFRSIDLWIFIDLKSSPRPISIIKLHTLPRFHR